MSRTLIQNVRMIYDFMSYDFMFINTECTYDFMSRTLIQNVYDFMSYINTL